MVRDFKFNRQNAEKNEIVEEIENIPVNSNDSSSNQPSCGNSDEFRVPLNSIPVPEQTVKSKADSDQEALNKSRVNKTPTKAKGKNVDPPALPLRTPDKAGNAAKSRFGWSTMIEGRSDMANYLSQSGKYAGGGAGSLNLTPRMNRATNGGRTSSGFSEASSIQTTPTKSVNKPPNPGFGSTSVSRYTGHGSVRAGGYAALSRGSPAHSTASAVVNTVEVPHFDLKEDPSFWMDHNIQVIIRVRPLNSMERSTQGYNRCVRQESGQTITWTGQPETRFTFDHVACETVDQEMLFRMAGLPMVENCLSGYNSCMFAYGQTGSGKTYTMLGEIEDLEFKPSLNRGMTPRIFEFLFARIRAEEESRRDEQLKYSCKCSFLEIYNEQITDLLDPSSTNLLLREDVRKGVYVENLSEVEVHTVGDIVKLLAQGSSNRKVAATNMNRESSRSHSVFTCVIESKWDRDSSTNLRFARLNLVDLAGSERQKTSGAEGGRLKEAANINKSLSTLGHVIMVLVDIAQGKPKHVPYRDSRLTFLLQDSLGGNSKTMIIANISPSICCAAETLNTLKFAQRAKCIQNNAVVNEDSSGDVSALQHQIRVLKEELSAIKRQNVSRPLLFVPASLTNPGTVSEGGETETQELDVSKGDDMHGCGPKDGVTVSSKQLKAMETILAGALRREQMAEASIKQLEAEREQLNRLVHQREEDSQCTKMMLKFREDKIHRMESFLSGLKPADAYLLEENTALSEQIQLLRVKLDKNPEVTRFAMENIRLLEQLRRFQDFYEEGEREIILKEVSELRDQLFKLLDGNAKLHSDEKQQIPPREATNSKDDTLHLELKKAHNDLEECQSKLKYCLESNAKLSREIVDLQALLNKKKSATCDCYRNVGVIKASIIEVPVQSTQSLPRVQNEKHGTVQEDPEKHAEEMVNLQIELDILKIILKEESFSREKLEEMTFCLKYDLIVAEESIFLMNKQYDSVKEELQESKLVIEALESHHLMSIKEIDDLRTNNLQNSELSRKQELVIFNSEEQISGLNCNDQLAIKLSRHEDSFLQEKLNKMQASLDMAKRLNELYHDDHAFNQSSEKEIEEVRQQAEAETAEVIVCLQEELSTLQLQVQNSVWRESETKSRLLLLETQMRELQNTLDSMSQDNEALHEQLEEKGREMKQMLEDWELLGNEIESVLTDGHATLIDTSDQLDSISGSVTRSSRWISEQVGKVMQQVSEKEFLIKKLQKYLEIAESKRNDVECMFRSLKGAALVITESHQQECYAKEREILKLRSELSAKLSTIVELENRIKLGHNQMRKASSCATVAFLLVNRLSEMNSCNQEALRLMGDQLTESVENSKRKDNILGQQTVKLEEIEKEIQGLNVEFKLVNDSSEMLRRQLEDWENCLSEMQKRLQANEVFGIQQTKEKLSELKTGVSRVQSRVNEYVQQAGNLCQKSHYKLCYLDDDCSSKAQDNGQADQKDGEACWHSVQNINNDNFECIVKEPENVSMESKIYDDRQDFSIILLKKEIESALESLKGMEADISCLLAEKEGIRRSERQGCHGLEVLRDQVLNLQVVFNDFEEQCGLRLQPLHDKVLKVEKAAQETESIWHQRRELLESQLDEAKMVAAQKTSETSCLLARFEEAQDMMKEADVMINGLMIANETLKLQIKELKNNEILVTRERDCLAQETQSMRCSNESKIQQYEHLEEQWESGLKNIGSVIQELEVFIAQTKNSNKEEVIDLVADLQSIKFLVCSKTNSVKSWLEDVWSEIIAKDTALSVLHLCHMGVLLEAVSGLNAENGILIHGLSESNSLIFNLREHNMKSKQELEMCEILKWKLLADIKNSFDRLLKKEDGTWKLGMKLSSFEQKLSDLQLQVELMFERSNYITDELANLMNEFLSSHSNVLETLLEQEELLRESEKIIETQDENYMIGLCNKDFELFILSSEMKQLANQRAAMECEELTYNTILEYMKEKIVTLGVNVDFKEQLMFEMGNEITVLQKEVEEVHGQLTKRSESVSELSHSNDILKQDLENLNDRLKGELHELREDKVTLVSQIDKLQAQSELLSMNLLLKEKECEHLSSQLLILDEENQKLHNDISSQVCSSEKLQNELLVKNARLSKSSCLEEENEMLRKEMQELGVENMKLARDLEEKESEVISSASYIKLLNSKTLALQEMVQSLDSRVNVLQEDIEIKKAELNILQCSHFTIKEELHGKSQELQRCFSKMNALQEENICLRNELSSFECKAFSLSCSNAASCVNVLEAAHIQTHKKFELLDEKIVLLLDHITDDACQHQEVLTSFIDRLEFLDRLTKEMMSENLSFQAELTRKDEVLIGLLFDLSLLQESASNNKVQEDDIEELMTSLKFKEDGLARKSHELDEAASHIQALEAQLVGKVDIICSLEMNLLRKSQSVDELSNENKELQFHIQEILGEKASIERELSEKGKVADLFKVELSEMEKTICKMRNMHESLKCNLDEVISEKAYLQKDLRILEGKLEAAEALAEEHEKIAAESQQVAESRRVYGEEKDEEVMLLENSVQELDSTINVLENKVDMLQGEAERQRLQREELELELQSLEHQLRGVKSADVDIERHLDEKERNHQEALKQIQCLEKDLAIKESEIVHCKQHISELNLHAEVQASEYKKKFKTLEAMAEQVKPENHSSHGRNSPAGKLEKNASKGRGSGSPFKCIGLGLAQQLKSEKDMEITAEKVRIEELEALAASRQKEIFMLNARLASAESMTHDVIRDLLGVKLDMNNYASLLHNEQQQKISDKVQLGGTMAFVKDEEVNRLKQQLNEFIEERQEWLVEIDRKQAELVAAQLALAKLRQRDQLLATENDILKMEISNHKKKAEELEGQVRQLSDQQNLQQRIHHHAKIKEENNVLRVQNEDLIARLRRAETILSRVREELARYRASSGRSTFINFDEEKRLSDKLKETEEERLHLAQKLVDLCTGILKAAGITKPVAQVNLSAALEAVEQLRNRITSLERELDDMKTKNKITTERIRLSELIPQPSPLSATTEGNCRTPRRGVQSPYFSTLDR